MKTKHSVLLAEHEGDLYVQRPQNWISGWARHLMMRRHISRKVSIASPDFWQRIVETSKIMTLSVYEDGTSDLK